MTLEEVIEILNGFLPPDSDGLDSDEQEAIRLDIEALKRFRDGRSKGYDFFAHLLPGETEEHSQQQS